MNYQFRYRFEAAHRLTSAESPMCQTPHGHTWYVSVQVGTGSQELNTENMVVEFQKAKKEWKSFIQDFVDHRFFVNKEDPILPHLKKEIPELRELIFPGDPTTEIIATLFLRKAEIFFAKNSLNVESLHLEETPVNSVLVKSDSNIYQNTIKRLFHKEAWWETN